MRPCVAQYWMAQCPTHGLTTFGTYYKTMDELADGCLKCHWEEPCRSKAQKTTDHKSSLARGRWRRSQNP